MIPDYRVRVRCDNFVDSYLGMTLKEELLLRRCKLLIISHSDSVMNIER